MNIKWIVLFLALAMLISAAGCAQEEPPAVEATVGSEPTEIATEATTGVGVDINVLGEPDFSEVTEEPAQAPDQETADETPQPTEGNDPAENETSPPPATEENAGGNQNTTVIVTEYEKYCNMSGEEQTAFILSFPSVEDFFAWLNNAKAEHEQLKPDIEIGDGTVDLGGGNG